MQTGRKRKVEVGHIYRELGPLLRPRLGSRVLCVKVDCKPRIGCLSAAAPGFREVSVAASRAVGLCYMSMKAHLLCFRNIRPMPLLPQGKEGRSCYMQVDPLWTLRQDASSLMTVGTQWQVVDRGMKHPCYVPDDCVRTTSSACCQGWQACTRVGAEQKTRPQDSPRITQWRGGCQCQIAVASGIVPKEWDSPAVYLPLSVLDQKFYVRSSSLMLGSHNFESWILTSYEIQACQLVPETW